jgi:hypothetical protein
VKCVQNLHYIISLVIDPFHPFFSGDEPDFPATVDDAVPGPNDITKIPDDMAAEQGDTIRQAEVLECIIANTIQSTANIDAFNKAKVKTLLLSKLEKLYQTESDEVLDLLSKRNTIQIDERFRLEIGAGTISMRTDNTKLDFHLTVANCIGLSAILPNRANSHRFTFDMDLKKPYRDFKGKHAMVGFDTQGKLLYIGRSMNEDVFLAMAPNDFISHQTEPSHPGHSTGSSVLSRKHYRQLIMMFAHFLAMIPNRAYSNVGNIYSQNLDEKDPNWSDITNIMYVICFPVIILSANSILLQQIFLGRDLLRSG